MCLLPTRSLRRTNKALHVCNRDDRVCERASVRQVWRIRRYSTRGQPACYCVEPPRSQETLEDTEKNVIPGKTVKATFPGSHASLQMDPTAGKCQQMKASVSEIIIWNQSNWIQYVIYAQREPFSISICMLCNCLPCTAAQNWIYLVHLVWAVCRPPNWARERK